MKIKSQPSFLRRPVALTLLAFASVVYAQQGDESRQPLTPESKTEVNSVVQMLSSTPALRSRETRYTVRPGDVVQINFLLATAFNQVQAVQPDGYMALQNLGEVYAAGKTVPELTEAIAQRYATIMQAPSLTVMLKEFERPYFIATGYVEKAGKYDLKGITTVTQAIAIAGGFRDSAKSSNVLLFRRVSNSYVSIKQLNLSEMLSHGNLHEDVELQPGDLVFVPKSVTASVFKALLPHTSTGFYVPLK